jgi:hypothetical protein
MTINTTGFLIIGLIFLVVGFYSCWYDKWRKINGYVPLVIGLFAVYLTTIGPLSKSRAEINKVRKIDGDKVESILIHTGNPGEENSFKVCTDTLLTDKGLINDLCDLLNEAIPASPRGYVKRPGWNYKIQINLANNETVNFEVCKFKQSTFLSVVSRGKNAWHYGDLKANEFGVLLNKIFNL